MHHHHILSFSGVAYKTQTICADRLEWVTGSLVSAELSIAYAYTTDTILKICKEIQVAKFDRTKVNACTDSQKDKLINEWLEMIDSGEN